MKICSELCGVVGHLHDGATTSISMSLDLSKKKERKIPSLCIKRCIWEIVDAKNL